MNRTTNDKESRAEPVESSESESAYRRWSRRKREARAAARPEVGVSETVAVPKVEANESISEPILTDADMPPIETLSEHSDYSMFMAPGVSETLRQAALRRLFSAPRFNELCELEGEFFDARNLGSLGNIVTYDMRAALERELEKAKAAANENLKDQLTHSEEKPDVTASPPSPEAGAKTVDRQAGDSEPDQGDSA